MGYFAFAEYPITLEEKMIKATHIFLLIILLVMLSACQSTPQEKVVIGKNDGKLEEIIENSHSDIAKIDKVKESEIWKETFSTKDNCVVFEIDSEIYVPEVDGFPVVYISPKNITQKMADMVLDTLIGSNTLYEESEEMTKREIKREIINIEYAIANEYTKYKESDPEEYEYLIKRATLRLEELYKLFESAPEVPSNTASRYFNVPDGSECEGENAPLIDNGTLTKEQVERIESEQLAGQKVIKGEVDLGKEEMAKIEIYKYSPVNQGIWFKNGDVDRMITFDPIVADISKDEAIDVARKALESMGLEDFELYQTGYSRVWNQGEEEETYAVKFLFKRVVNNVSISHVDESKYRSGGQSFMEPWGSERIWIAIDKTGILSFRYSYPIKIDEIANDNVDILPFEEIKEIFKKQMQIGYAWNADEHIISQDVTIDRIELGLARVARRNNSGHMLVPAWNFYGYETYTYDEQQPGGWQLDENNQVVISEYATSFLTINAIDGSLIDNHLGY